MSEGKKRKLNLKYITSRAILLGGVVLLVLLVFALAQTSLALRGEASVLQAIGLWALILLIIVYAWLGIIRPFYRSEKLMQRMLDGYTLRETDDLDLEVMTPVMQEEVELLKKIVNSPQTMELNKRQAQYLALQNQINPHFLYNTLESIRGEALIAGLDGVAEMTEGLAKFFRYTITKVENLVSVEEELDNCETYFSIQKYRFGDRLQLNISYDPEEWEEIMNCRIPKLTLQPIVENSIIHGTELKVGTGNILIRFDRTQDRLLIRISDNGVGMDEETLAALNRNLLRGIESPSASDEERQGGIALANVNNRIHLIFGDEYGLHVYSVPGEGTDVEISLPIVTSDKEIANRGILG